MTSVAFVIPGPPVPKGRPRFSRSGHSYTDARTREYESIVKGVAMGAALKAGKVPVFGSGVQVAFRLNIYRAANRGDIDNFCKVVSDAINGVIWSDDRQIVHIEAWMGTDKSEPRVEVSVEAA